MIFENRTARLINHHLQEYFYCLENSEYIVHSMINAYNWANRTNIMRTEREHRACDKLKTFMKKRLKLYHGWKEDEKGRLVLT